MPFCFLQEANAAAAAGAEAAGEDVDLSTLEAAQVEAEVRELQREYDVAVARKHALRTEWLEMSDALRTAAKLVDRWGA